MPTDHDESLENDRAEVRRFLDKREEDLGGVMRDVWQEQLAKATTAEEIRAVQNSAYESMVALARVGWNQPNVRF